MDATRQTGKRLAYIRVSTLDQNTQRQLDGIPVDKTFVDKASGKDVLRPALVEMMEFARAGDTVVVHSIDRLARSLMDLKGIVNRLTGKGVSVQFLKENLVFNGAGDSPMSIQMLNLLASFAEFERDLIRERQREGITLAQRAGKYRGRKKKVVDVSKEMDVVKGKIVAGVSKARIAREMGVSRATLYKYLGLAASQQNGTQPEKGVSQC